MFAPGRIVHLTEHAEPRQRQQRAPAGAKRGASRWGLRFSAGWVSRDGLATASAAIVPDAPPAEDGSEEGLGRCLLLPGAVTDHFPWHIIDALDGAIANHRSEESGQGELVLTL